MADMGRHDEALAIYRKALRDNPHYRSLSYAYLDQLLQTGHPKEVLADLDERLRTVQDDARLYELQARAYEASGRRIAQHRSQGEAYFRKGNLAAACDPPALAGQRMPRSDCYQ